MKSLSLTSEQHQQLNQLLRRYRDYRIWRRLQTIRLRSQGCKSKDIAIHLDIRGETISLWVKLFQTQGFEPLLKLNYQGSVSVLAPYKNQLEEIIHTKRIATLSVLQQEVEQHFGVIIGETGLYKWCKKNSVYPLKRLA